MTAKEVWWIVLSIFLFVCLTSVLVAKLVRQSKFVFPCKIIEELREKAAKIKVGSVYPIAPAPESEEEPPCDSTVFFVYKMI